MTSMRHLRAGVTAALFLGTLSGPVLAQATPAQTPPQSGAPAAQSGGGLGPLTATPGEIARGQNAILPSGGTSGPSAAPTMVFDCKANPRDCAEGASAADKTTAPRVSPAP